MRAILLLIIAGIVVGSGFAGAATKLPAFKPERWVNSAPLTAEALRGKVILVDFWEYTCINWIRTLPFIKAWNRDYAALGLVVVGVHA
jgi:thiol-disulfide isomerase/thioredoxin